MRIATGVIIGCVCCIALARSESAAVSLLLSGTFHRNEVQARTGERWYGLFHVPSGFTWRPVTITTRRVNDPVVDEDGEKTGVGVFVKGASPVVLIKGLNGLEAKKVRGVLDRPEGLDLPRSEALELSMPEERVYRLRVADRRVSDGAPQKTSRLVLEAGSQKQVLYEWPTGLLDQHCELIWAGDLDGDGKLDLFMALSHHYNVVEYTLFLSSKRSGSNLVHRVAVFETKGC